MFGRNRENRVRELWAGVRRSVARSGDMLQRQHANSATIKLGPDGVCTLPPEFCADRALKDGDSLHLEWRADGAASLRPFEGADAAEHARQTAIARRRLFKPSLHAGRAKSPGASKRGLAALRGGWSDEA